MKRLLGVLLVLIFASTIHANYLEETALEENIQTKAQHILDTMFGPHLFSVATKVSLGRESWMVNYTERADIDFKEKKNTESEKYNILPGYEAIKNLSPNEAVQMPFNSRISKLPGSIINIVLDIVVSKTVPKQDVKNVNKLLTKVLSLDEERGDVINFVFEDFPIVAANKEVTVGLPVEAKLMISVLILTSLFVIVYILLKIKQLNIHKEAVKAQLETAKATANTGSTGSSMSDIPTEPALPAPVLSDGGDDGVIGFFSFVGPHNARQFVNLLKNKELDVEQLAIVVSYLDPNIAKKVLETLDEAKQLEVVTALCDEKIADKDMLEEINGDLKTEIECAVGGASKLEPVISCFKDEQKKTFLNGIQSNAEVYAQVRPNIFLFEDIEKLDDSDVKKLIGALKIEVLAASIAADNSGASQKIKANLTGAAQAMVTQFVDIKKDSLKESDVTNAQQQVVQQMKQLSDSGTIDVVSKITS